MKKVALNASSKLFLFLSLSVLFLTSCSSDDDDPSYVGTWTAYDGDIDGTSSAVYKHVMTLGKSTFVDTIKVYKATSLAYINYRLQSGTVSTSGVSMTFKISSYGVSSDGSSYTTYAEGSTGFTSALATDSVDQSSTSTYAVVSKTLTLTQDGSALVFTKE